MESKLPTQQDYERLADHLQSMAENASELIGEALRATHTARFLSRYYDAPAHQAKVLRESLADCLAKVARRKWRTETLHQELESLKALAYAVRIDLRGESTKPKRRRGRKP